MKTAIAVGLLVFLLIASTMAMCPSSVACALDGQSMYFTGATRLDSYGHLERLYEHLAVGGGKHQYWIVCN